MLTFTIAITLFSTIVITLLILFIALILKEAANQLKRMLQAVSHEYTTRDIDAMVQKKHGVCVVVGGRGVCVCV